MRDNNGQGACSTGERAETPTKLPPRAQALLDRLVSEYCRRNPWCWPGEDRLAGDLGISERQVRRLIALLVENGLMSVARLTYEEQDAEGMRRHNTNTYFIPPRGQECPQDGECPPDKNVLRTRTKMSSGPGQKCPQDIAPTLSIEFDLREGGNSEGADPTPPIEIAHEDEHPLVVEQLHHLHEFDALPGASKERIESYVREEYPLHFGASSSDDYDFRVQCVAMMLARRKERPFLGFKTSFIMQVAGCPKDADFIDAWEPWWDRMVVTVKEGAELLEMYIHDPRRENPKWEGRFARDAIRHFPKYLKSIRHKPPQATEQKANGHASIAPEPAKRLETDQDCICLADALCERLGAVKFEMWFAGKTRLSKSESAWLVGVPSAFLQDWLRKTFAGDIQAAIDSIGASGSVRFVIDEELAQAARQRKDTP